ncbi:MAG: hypothetical protein PHX68_02225 [Alphaproteobacteria bacterium]|nr:hypothetical protein [Alphaproteobacteria bacterium]
MFKLILLTGAALASGAVWAQGGLFPELQPDAPAPAQAPAAKPDAPAPVSKPVPPLAPKAATIGQALDASGSVALPDIAPAGDLPQVLQQQLAAAPSAPETSSAAGDKKDDKKTKEEIYIIASDVKSVQPPMQGFSYCTAQFSLVNKLKKQAQDVTVQLTYGTMKATLSFGGVAPDGEGKSSITLAGSSCAYIMSLPQMEIKSCVVPGMSAEECKKRVKLIPIS